jgi:hypothetical protein
MSTTTAVAVLLTVTATASTRLITVHCPFCHRHHHHGWPYSEPSIGHRVAHCVDGGAGGYDIPTPAKGTR